MIEWCKFAWSVYAMLWVMAGLFNYFDNQNLPGPDAAGAWALWLAWGIPGLLGGAALLAAYLLAGH